MVVLMVVLASATASAYTIVMRDGRMLSIPNNFVVSKLTMTYAVSDQFQITLSLASIDIAATERVNNEPAGSFLLRGQPAASSSQQTGVRNRTTTTRRTITNEQLQKFQAKRLSADAAYEQRRKEQGLPSKEELLQLAQDQIDRTAETVRDLRQKEQEEERYWRERSSGLRAELASTNAQVDFVRARLNELPAFPTVGFVPSLPFGAPLSPFNTFSQTAFSVGSGFQRRNVVRSPLQVNTARPMRGGFPGHRSFGGSRFGGGFARVQIGSPAFGNSIFPFNSAIGGFPYQDFSYERQELMLQLNDLLSQRAGLQARWRDLEEEARTAGAYPGWLRP